MSRTPKIAVTLVILLSIACSKVESSKANASANPATLAERQKAIPPMPQIPHEAIDSGPRSDKIVDYHVVVEAPPNKRPLTPLELDLLAKMRSVNSSISTASIVSIRPWAIEQGDYMAPDYQVLVNSGTPDNPHPDKYTNLEHAADMYGLFLVNHEFTRATHRLGLFVSPRTGDYSAQIVGIVADSVLICGEGAMYGDAKQRWTFLAEPARASERKWQDSVMKTLPPAKTSAVQDDEGDDGLHYVPPHCPWESVK